MSQFNKAFKQLDQDASGTIDYSEFVEWWQKQKARARERLQRSAAAVKTGAVASTPEQGQGGATLRADEEAQRLEAVWKSVDRDQSGTLDLAEMKDVFKAMGQNLNERQVSYFPL